MRRKIRSIDYTQRFVDACIVYTSWLISYALRFILEIGGKSAKNNLNWYLTIGLLLLIVSTIIFKNSKIYDKLRFSSLSKEIASQIRSNAIASILFLVLAFFTSEYRVSRIMFIFYLVLSTSGLVYSKVFFRKIIQRKKQRVLLIGDGQSILKYYNNLQATVPLEIVDWIEPPEKFKHFSTGQSLDHVESLDLDDIVIGYDNDKSTRVSNYLKTLAESLVPIIILPDISFAKIGYSMSDFKGQPLIYLNDPQIKQMNLIIKRVFDFCLTLLGSILISPILFMIAILIKVTSRGPVLYSQIRMGVDGKSFKMWKFRSMVVGQENKEGWTVKNDPRVTSIGKILRKTNLDELPQLWNVLKGEMSLIGPRPERPEYVEKFRQEIPGYMIRHRFKAGMTGWAQINGWRGDTSISKRIEYDLWYIRNWSLWLDLTILFMTFYRGQKNAY